MSVIIKTSEMQYRDQLGNYHGINAIAEKKIADQVADLDAAISSAQTAVDGIDAQRQTMIASIASVAGQGTDTTLTQSGVAADAKSAGDEIRNVKSAFLRTSNLATGVLPLEWEQGGLYYGNGGEYASTKQIRTKYFTVTQGVPICVAGLDTTNYSLYVHEFTSVGTQSGNAKSLIYKTYVPSTSLVRFRITRQPDTIDINPSEEPYVFYKKSGFVYDSVPLPNNTDLDNLKNGGSYYLASTNTYPHSVVANMPGILIIYGDGTNAVQFFSCNGKMAYYRNINSGTWTEWRTFGTVGGALQTGEDINLRVRSGTFSFTYASTADITGLPITFIREPGVLIVSSGDQYIGRTVQMLITQIQMFTRYHDDRYDPTDSSVGWSDWDAVYNQNGISLGAGSNIDELFETCHYFIFGSDISNIDGTFPLNWSKTACALICYKGAGGGRSSVQALVSAGNRGVFVRYYNGESWEAWSMLTPNRMDMASGVGVDVNTFISPGDYSLTMAASQNITGLPIGFNAPGVLTVISGKDNGTVGRTVQMLFDGINNNIYTRYHNDNYDEEDSSVGWTDWKSLDQVGFDAKRYLKHRTNSALQPLGLPAIYIEGDMSGISKETAVNITWKYVTNAASGTGTTTSDEYKGTLKWQGRGSLSFPKKNFTLAKIKKASDTSIEGYDFGWGTQKKYCLKGNYLDPSMANNLTGAKLWGDLAADHSETYPAQLVSSPNYGTVDGFPIMLFINGEYQGVYNLNVPKDKWMADMTLAEGTAECIVCSDASTDTCAWAALAETLEDLQTGWCLEELSDGIVEREGEDKYTGVALHALNQAIGAVMTAYTNQDHNWEQTVGQYIDIDSAIDFYILRCLIDDRDAMRNNQLMFTYNLADPRDNPETPTKWYFIPYDMDMTFGASNLYYSTERLLKIGVNRFSVYATQNRLFYLIYNYSKDRLKARYTVLRKYHLAYRNVYYRHGGITAQIPAGLMDYEHVKWPLVPADNLMSTVQAMEHYRINCEVCDEDLYDESLLT